MIEELRKEGKLVQKVYSLKSQTFQSPMRLGI